MVTLFRFSSGLRWNHHSRLPLLLFAFVLLSLPLRAQTISVISSDFDTEMSGYIMGTDDTTLLPTSRSPVPPWICSGLPMQNDTLYVMGISDPGLADSVARRQAILRAVALGAMENGTKCKHLTDFFSQAKGVESDSKYQEIYCFTAGFSENLPPPGIIKDTILPSTEAIVLVAIPKKHLQKNHVKNMWAEAYFYNNDAAISNGNNISRTFDVSIREKKSYDTLVLDACSFYQLNGKASGMRCLWPKSQFVYNHYEFYYTTGQSVPFTDSVDFHGTTCKQGLWIAYVSQIMENLSMQTKRLVQESMNVTSNASLRSAELVRERSQCRLSWRINDLSIRDDKMLVNLSVSSFQPFSK